MEANKKIYETDTQILSFVGSGNICFCDDYPFQISVDGITYPSVRHAMLSWKTTDLNSKKLIAKATLPADLKDLEKTIAITFKDWTLPFITATFRHYTFEKFVKVKEFGKKLKLTQGKELIADSLQEYSSTCIEETKTVENFHGKILMNIRNRI